MMRFGSRNACCANKKETLCFAWFFLSFSSSHSKLVFFMNIIYYMYGGKRNITIWLLMWILYVCTEERNKRLCFESVPLSTISSRLTHHPPPTYNAGNGRHKRAYPAESKEAQRAGYNSGDILFNSSLSVLQ